MAGDQHRAARCSYRGIAVVLGLNLQHGGRRKTFEEHPSFNFRLHDVAIHFIAEIGMGCE